MKNETFADFCLGKDFVTASSLMSMAIWLFKLTNGREVFVYKDEVFIISHLKAIQLLKAKLAKREQTPQKSAVFKKISKMADFYLVVRI